MDRNHTTPRASRAARTTRFALAIAAATAALAVTIGPAFAQAPPQQLEPGVYDSYRRREGESTLNPTSRTLTIRKFKLSYELTVQQPNRAPSTQPIVSTCPIRYDGRLGNYYQDFVTKPTNPRVPSERIRFVFRQNDIADYDVYYLDQVQSDGSYASEILVRQGKF